MTKLKLFSSGFFGVAAVAFAAWGLSASDPKEVKGGYTARYR